MIPFLDLRSQYLSIENEVSHAIKTTLESAQYVLGPSVTSFERNFAAYCKTSHAVGVSSGAAALHLALLAAGIAPGDEVITVSMTFVATIAAILYCGAKPVLIDIDPTTGNMDPTEIEAAITAKTKAIVPVHLHGRMTEMSPILRLAKTHGLVVIEDAAQAHGAEYEGKRAGSVGNMGCFSFYPGKNLGAYGEAGAVTTNNTYYAEKIRQLRDWGQTQKYYHDLQGFNYRMDALQAAILDVKLRYLEEWIIKRQSRALLYNEYLDEMKIFRPCASINDRHVYHVYAIRLADRHFIKEQLQQLNIATNIHYPVPVHLQKAYAHACVSSGTLRATERFAQETLSLPIFPELTDQQIAEVCLSLKNSLKKKVVV